MDTRGTIAAVTSKLPVGRSLPTLVSGPLIIRETVYGIVKRVEFFIEHVEAYRRRKGLEAHEVRILDVGCGTGVNVTVPLAHAGFSIMGLDLDSASIERGRLLAEGLRNIEFHCGSIEDQVVSQLRDVVICSEVLEHLQEPAIFIEKLKSVLKEGGLLLVTVPNGFGYFELDNLFWQAISRFPRLIQVLYKLESLFWGAFGSPEHLRRRKEENEPRRLELNLSTLARDTRHCQSFTRSKIDRLLESQGLRILKIRNNTFLAGNTLALFVREFDRFLAWNARAADRLPSFLVSGWLIAAEKCTVNGGSSPSRY